MYYKGDKMKDTLYMYKLWLTHIIMSFILVTTTFGLIGLFFRFLSIAFTK